MAAEEEHDDVVDDDVEDVVEAFDETRHGNGDVPTVDNFDECLLEPKLRRIDCKLCRKNDSRFMLAPKCFAGVGVVKALVVSISISISASGSTSIRGDCREMHLGRHR